MNIRKHNWNSFLQFPCLGKKKKVFIFNYYELDMLVCLDMHGWPNVGRSSGRIVGIIIIIYFFSALFVVVDVNCQAFLVNTQTWKSSVGQYKDHRNV